MSLPKLSAVIELIICTLVFVLLFAGSFIYTPIGTWPGRPTNITFSTNLMSETTPITDTDANSNLFIYRNGSGLYASTLEKIDEDTWVVTFREADDEK